MTVTFTHITMGNPYTCLDTLCLQLLLHHTDSPDKPDPPCTFQIFLQLFSNIRETLTDISAYHIFTDQFYASPTLASELSLVGCHLTGTWKDVPAFINKKPPMKR